MWKGVCRVNIRVSNFGMKLTWSNVVTVTVTVTVADDNIYRHLMSI